MPRGTSTRACGAACPVDASAIPAAPAMPSVAVSAAVAAATVIFHFIWSITPLLKDNREFHVSVRSRLSCLAADVATYSEPGHAPRMRSRIGRRSARTARSPRQDGALPTAPRPGAATVGRAFVIMTYSSMWNLPGARVVLAALRLRRADSRDLIRVPTGFPVWVCRVCLALARFRRLTTGADVQTGWQCCRPGVAQDRVLVEQAGAIDAGRLGAPSLAGSDRATAGTDKALMTMVSWR